MATAAGRAEELSPRAKNAIWGAFLGFFVDMFDIYLPVVVSEDVPATGGVRERASETASSGADRTGA